MEVSKETEQGIQELRILEQNLQSIAMQKQAFELELSEVSNALSEVEKTKDDVFKISGNIMIKASKDDLAKELKEKKDFLALKFKSLETQEKNLTHESEDIRKRVLSQIKKK